MAFSQNAPRTERIQAVLAEAIQVPLDMITPELSFGDLPEWDSMGHMEVMMRLEEIFGVEITAETIAALTSIPKISAYLEENGHVQ